MPAFQPLAEPTDTSCTLTAVGVLAVNTSTSVTVIGVAAIVGALPKVMFKTPAATDAVVAVPALVTLGMLTLLVVKDAAEPLVTVTLEVSVWVTVSCGNVLAVKLATSVIVSVLVFRA